MIRATLAATAAVLRGRGVELLLAGPDARSPWGGQVKEGPRVRAEGTRGGSPGQT